MSDQRPMIIDYRTVVSAYIIGQSLTTGSTDSARYWYRDKLERNRSPLR